MLASRMMLFLLLGGCACIPEDRQPTLSSKSAPTELSEIPGCRIAFDDGLDGLVRDAFLNAKPAIQQQQTLKTNTRLKVMLVDEVDVFFSFGILWQYV